MLSGMYQEELGRLLGITYQQLSKYEKGENRINLSKLIIACHFMDVKIDEFFKTLNIINSKYINYGKHINKYLSLSDYNKDLVNKIIEIL